MCSLISYIVHTHICAEVRRAELVNSSSIAFGEHRFVVDLYVVRANTLKGDISQDYKIDI